MKTLKYLMTLAVMATFYSGFAQPLNDDCANAQFIELGSECVSLSYTSVDASSEPVTVAPNPTCGLYQGGDVWFSFEVPASGNFRIERSNLSSGSAYWALYSGSCGTFNQLLCTPTNSNFAEPGLAGETLYLRVWTFNSDQGNDFSLCIWEIDPPANDNCANAIGLPVGTSCVPQNFSTQFSTSEDLSVASNPTCGLYQGGDVWFSFEVPASGNFRIERSNLSSGSAYWALYSGSCGSFNQLLCTPTNSNFVEPDLAGETLYLRVWTFNSQQGNDFSLCVWEIDPPTNDECANATWLTLSDECVYESHSSQFATSSSASTVGNPSCGIFQGGDVWFAFEAPASGQFAVNRNNLSSGSAYLAVYSGTCGDFTEISCDGSSTVNFNDPTLGGQTLYLRSWVFNSAQGNDFELCVINTTIASNDNCADAIALDVNSTCEWELFDNFNTTEEAGIAPNPSCGVYQGGDVWFSFEVPATGQLQINRNNLSVGNYYFTVYEGTCGNFTELECSGGDPQILLNDPLLAAETLYLRLHRFNSSFGGEFELCLVAGDCNAEIGGTAFIDECETCVGGNTGIEACVQDCNGVFGGTAFLDNCNDCVGGNTGETACVQDCNGDFGGTAFLDNCGDCVSGNTGETACTADCNGDFGGTAFLDNCGDCVGGNTGETECIADCNGVFGGTAFLDNCGDCVGGNTGETACVQDCNGDFGGTAFLDNCGDCVSGNTGETACTADCNGDFGGTAFLDNCGDCVEGNTGETACVQDCNGDFGGTAFLDNCGDCVGGNTGETECIADCNGVFGGTAFLDNCGDCVGGNTGETACVQDCNGDFGGTAFLDNCGDCVSGNTGENACTADCNGDFGGTAFLDNCGDCVEGNTGETACTADCNGDFGGTAFLDNCNDCVGGNTGLSACTTDCGNPQTISSTTYPSTNWSTGNLSPAATSGLPVCDGAIGPDVYYTFNVPTENHYWVTVNPIGGADVVVEVLNSCGGSTLACANDNGDGGQESAFVQNLVPGDYIVRVHNSSGVTQTGATGSFLINVQSFPTAKVQDNPSNVLYACNQSDFQLEDFVGASPQTGQLSGILDYEWLVAEQGGTEQTIWQRGAANYASRIDWLGMEYNATYNVYVRIQLNIPGVGPVWGVHQVNGPDPNAVGAQECTISTSSDVTLTELLPAYQGTNVDGNPYQLCDFAIAFNVLSSENYRWRFDVDLDPNNGNEIIYTRGSGNPSVRLSWVDGLLPGVPYNVDIEVRVDGQWSGYGNVHQIVLGGVPNVAVRSQYCGGTYAPNGYLLSESVCEADFYRFRFTPQFAGATRQKTVGSYVLGMGTINPPLEPGTYNVQVQVQQGGVLGDYSPSLVGDACEITISGPTLPGGEAPVAQRSETFGNAMLHPNPNAGSEVRMELDGLSDGNHEVMIQIYDVYGKLIQTDGFGHEGNRLSRLVRFENELAMGMYMLQILVDDNRFATERMIVK